MDVKNNNNSSAHERAQLLLDATPLACRLMKRVSDSKYEPFECNEEAVRLFKFKNKQEFLERYFEIFPKYQPDGSVSTETGQKYFEKAFAEGRCVSEFTFQTSHGEPLPCEVTLVRLEYEDDYIVAGYTRDMREHNRMMEAIEKRNKMINTGNLAVETLLSTEDDIDISEALLESLKIVGIAIGGDRVRIWRNELIDGELYFVHTYEWQNEVGKQQESVPIGIEFPYSAVPEWKEIFSSGRYINGLLRDLSQQEQRFLDGYGIKAVLVIPMFIKRTFWGFLSIENCDLEEVFAEDEISIISSISSMLASAINRSMQAVQIHEAHERTRLLLDTSPIVINLWDKNSRIFDCNEESVRLFNMKDKVDYANRFHDLSPDFQPDGSRSSEVAPTKIKKAFEDGKNVFEWMHQTSDGIPIPSEVTLVRVAYDDDFAVAGYIRDLREQKEMMREIQQKSVLLDNMNTAANILLQSEIDEFEDNLQICMGMMGKAVKASRFRMWKNSIIDGKLHFSLEYEWVTSVFLRSKDDLLKNLAYEDNLPKFEQLFKRGECVNSVVRDLPPLEQERMKEHGVKSIFAAPVYVQDEFWGFVSCDNCYNENVFSEEVAASLLSGCLLITNAIVRNEMTLNMRKAAEKLEAALIETQRANNAKSDFLATMSHEMRTPLNAIIGLTWLSLEKNNIDIDIRSNLVKAHNAGTTLLGLVNNILDISKIESGKLDLVPVEYSIASLINDTVTQNLLRIGEKPIKLKLNISENIYEILYGDELRLNQIMNNLLSNAIKYTDKGEVRFGISCEREGDTVWLTIEVGDTGQGIKRSDLVRLFDDYAQLDTNANRMIEGTGLGLPIAKMLCEMMDGSISVESEYGKGSVFTARLKQKFVDDAVIGPDIVASLNSFSYMDGRRAKEMTLKRVSLPYAHVLIVDDNQTNLDVAKGLMKPYQMQIDCVDSGQKAIDLIDAGRVKYDAVFMDQMMPGMDGIEATQHIRELGTDYAVNLPIIALTANAVVGNEEMFLSKGFQAFLSKPIDIARLDAVIRQWIRKQDKEKMMEITEVPKESQSVREEPHRTSERVFSGKEITSLDYDLGVERFGGDEEVYIGVLRSFMINTRNLLEPIANVTENGLYNYEISVHSIKGSSYGICADSVGRLASDLERAAKAFEFGYIKKQNESFIKVVKNLIDDIEGLLETYDSLTKKPIKDKPDKAALSALAAACNAYDMDAVDAAMEEMTRYQYEDDDGLVQWICENVESMNFDEIVDKIVETMIL
ncbi:MAG: ATP-binding protein [Oscillospiraceae bacterium]|nr:ATP-binding protein [Oscillospiraceae bacterium]